nr:uncharacterized protein LOC101255521 [Solanum lycopersicum]
MGSWRSERRRALEPDGQALSSGALAGAPCQGMKDRSHIGFAHYFNIKVSYIIPSLLSVQGKFWVLRVVPYIRFGNSQFKYFKVLVVVRVKEVESSSQPVVSVYCPEPDQSKRESSSAGLNGHFFKIKRKGGGTLRTHLKDSTQLNDI